MFGVTPKEEYSRADVRRKFGLSERQLRGWERQRLIPAATSYSFSDLVAFQTLIKLRENHIPAKEIFRALDSLREKLDWVKQPLSELRVVSDGGRDRRARLRAEDGGHHRPDPVRFRRRRAGRHQELSGCVSPKSTACANPRSGSRKGWNSKRPARPWKQAVDAIPEGTGAQPGSRRGSRQPRHDLLPTAQIRRGREILSGGDRSRSCVSAGPVQPRQPLRRAGTHA